MPFTPEQIKEIEHRVVVVLENEARAQQQRMISGQQQYAEQQLTLNANEYNRANDYLKFRSKLDRLTIVIAGAILAYTINVSLLSPANSWMSMHLYLQAVSGFLALLSGWKGLQSWDIVCGIISNRIKAIRASEELLSPIKTKPEELLTATTLSYTREIGNDVTKADEAHNQHRLLLKISVIVSVMAFCWKFTAWILISHGS
jgi:hypothetical protein